MTEVINGKAPDVTVRDDVRMCVRAPETPPTAPNPAPAGTESVGTRAIPRRASRRKGSTAAKVANFASLHAGDAGVAVGRGWALNEAPPTAVAVWRQVFPGKGEAPSRTAWLAMSTAGLYRAVVVTALWLVALSVATRIRAGVGLAVTVAAVLTGLVVGAVHH